MCYNVKAVLRSQLRRARLNGEEEDIDALQLELEMLGKGNYFKVSGFSHPELIIYKEEGNDPILATWGLIPESVKDADPIVFWKRFNTLNAKGETIFTSQAYRNSAESKHCLIYVDGFYEHHHHNGKAYPFFIHAPDEQPLPLAGLWSEWVNPATKVKLVTYTILTTMPNRTMAKIHNNPDRDGPRMPVILDDARAEEWLKPGLTQKGMSEFLVPYPEDKLAVYTVKPLTGKIAVKNDPTASDEFIYEELRIDL